MKRFVAGGDRMQGMLFPQHLDDFVDADNAVRAIDAFVDALDLGRLGFGGVQPALTGRPGYHPGAMLKIYLYGYLNRIQSSRRLEREAGRNVELMWLTNRLAPDFKTIADFRRDNGPAIRKACRQFVELCRQADLLGGVMVAVDGSKFKAVNSPDKNFTQAKVTKRIADLEASIARYLGEMDRADRDGGNDPELAVAQVARLGEKIEVLKTKMAELRVMEQAVEAAPDKQISLTDPDARAMKTRGAGIVGYNVQTAVDAKHHLIVTHEVINEGHDHGQLSQVTGDARAVMHVKEISAVADRGYHDAKDIVACETNKISVYVPKPRPKTKDIFDRSAFLYNKESDTFTCPAGEALVRRASSKEDGKMIHRYWTNACGACALKSDCTKGTERRIQRFEDEHVLEAVQRRLDLTPGMMKLRRCLVEHPFGTLKAWMGATHFLTRTLKNVRTEMSLHILAYNFKRALQILGMQGLMAAIRA
jgi:transposase